MTKRMVLMLIAVGLVFGGVYGFQTFKAGKIKQAMSGTANPPQTVSTVIAATQPWQPSIKAIGSLKAANGADLALQVSGIVGDISFQSGDMVEKDQTLLQLVADDAVALLDSLNATADLNALTLKRDQAQLKIQAVSQATLDIDNANLKNSRALVAQQTALIGQKTLKAPFAGRLGIRSVDLGQFLSSGTAIVTLQALDPIFVDLFLPQQALSQIKVGQAVQTAVDTYPGERFVGEITAIDPKVDTGTRNVQVRAKMKNPDGRLLPGMFAEISIAVGQPDTPITLPQTAIVSNPYGDSVFVADKAKNGNSLVARQAFVKTGLVRGDEIAVTDGVKAGESVVVAGQIKLRNGSPVVVDNSHVPVAEAAPNVVDQ